MKGIVKNLLEKILYFFYAKEYKNLYKIVENYEYVSFDIFDTLIKRNVADPKDIFDIVEKIYNQNNSHIDNFKENRIEAEKIARKKSSMEEVTLTEIYQKLDQYDSNQKRVLKNIEIQVEKDFCVRNTPVYEFYNYCIKKNKKIFLTSDMYLEKDVIESILDRSGYKNYNKLYLSSQEKLRKRTGHLFDKLLSENHINKDKLIHIGDSITGDFLIPRKKGINTILLSRKIKNNMFQSKNNKSLDYNILSSFINNNTYNFSTFEHIGYEILGPMLYDFTSWLHQRVYEEKFDKIYFLARDAKIIMEVYKKRYKEDIPLHYLKVSRRSVLIATIGDVKNLNDILEKYKSIIKHTSKVIDLINILNLDTKKYLDKDYFDKLIIDLSEEEKEKIYLDINFDLIKESKKQSKYLKEYLKQEDLSGKIAIVDIGWNGTIQHLLDNIVNSETKLYGYYFGVMKDKKYREYKSIRNGYLFDINNQNDNQSVIALNIGVFEMLFLSTEGSTIKYDLDNKKIRAISGKVEYSENNLKAVKQIQESALNFIENLDHAELKKYLQLTDKDTYFETFKNLTIYPTKKNIKIFKHIEFQNFNETKLINNKNLIYYLFHPKVFYIDFMNSYCKVMFMKNIFKIRLPYYKILKKLYFQQKQ